MNDARMLERLHDHLDRGEDPFADAVLTAWLEDHPEWLPLAATLRADARALGNLTRPVGLAAPRRRPRAAAALLAMATASSAAAWALWPTLFPPAESPQGPRARIVASSYEELRPRALLAGSFLVHEVALTTPSARLESYTLRSERR